MLLGHLELLNDSCFSRSRNGGDCFSLWQQHDGEMGNCQKNQFNPRGWKLSSWRQGTTLIKCDTDFSEIVQQLNNPK